MAKRNVASLRVLEKCGFVVTAEDVWIKDDGDRIEEFVLELL